MQKSSNFFSKLPIGSWPCILTFSFFSSFCLISPAENKTRGECGQIVSAGLRVKRLPANSFGKKCQHPESGAGHPPGARNRDHRKIGSLPPPYAQRPGGKTGRRYVHPGRKPTIQKFRDYWSIELAASQSIYSGGVNRQRIAIAKLQDEVALVQLQATTNQILKNVKYAVYALVVAQAEVDAQKKSIQLLADEVDRQKAYFDAGKTTRFNVLRTEVSLANQKSQLLEAQTNFLAARNNLVQLLNIDWSPDRDTQPFIIQETLDCPPMTNRLDDLIALALMRRPELQILQHQIDIDQRQIKVDKATNVPRIDAFAAVDQRRDQSQPGYSQNLNDYAVGFLGSWDIFDGFAGRGQAMADTASLDSTKISLNATRLQIQLEVRNAYARLKTEEEALSSQELNIKTAEDSVRLAQNSAEAGYATLLDVLQATVDLTTTRLDALRIRNRYLLALADLDYAISLKFVDQAPPKSL